MVRRETVVNTCLILPGQVPPPPVALLGLGDPGYHDPRMVKGEQSPRARRIRFPEGYRSTRRRLASRDAASSGPSDSGTSMSGRSPTNGDTSTDSAVLSPSPRERTQKLEALNLTRGPFRQLFQEVEEPRRLERT